MTLFLPESGVDLSLALLSFQCGRVLPQNKGRLGEG